MKARTGMVPKISFFIVVIVLLITLGCASQLITNVRGVRTSGGVDNVGSIGGLGGHPHVSTKILSNDNGVSHVTMDLSPTCMYDSSDFKIMGDAVERALNFFENNVEKLVLDAAVGTRSLEGQLSAILQRHPKLPSAVQQYLSYLLSRTNKLSNRIIQAIAKSTTISHTEKKHTLPWVTTPGLWDWPLNGVWESLSTMQSYEPIHGFNASSILSRSKETIEEKQSDACIYQVFNCQSQETTDMCRNLFFIQEQSLYSLTHQVIYTLFAKKKQCFRAIGSDELRRYQEKLCGKVWLEANAISQMGFSSNFADLFVEQVAICGMTGYPNFFRRDWLMQILKWQSQRKSGCFLDTRAQPPSSVTSLVKLYHQDQKKFHEIMNHHFQQQKLSQLQHKVTSRQKRSDAFLRQGQGNSNENCSVHFTAVGVTALAAHMRYFVDTCFPTY